jgi:AcrR family transcriptional regulator
MQVRVVTRDRPGEDLKRNRTRERIVEKAAQAIADAGLEHATAAEIAPLACLSRTAILYHFPTHELLLKAVVAHLQLKRLSMFREAAALAPHGPARTEYAIECYRCFLKDPAFLAFAELERAARTNAALLAIIEPAQREFDLASDGKIFDLIQGGESPRLQASRDLVRFTLEGLSAAKLSYGSEERADNIVNVLKRLAKMLNRKGAPNDVWPD